MRRTNDAPNIVGWVDDLPVFKKAGGKSYEKALVAPLNDQVTDELYFDGLNLVLSPCRSVIFSTIPLKSRLLNRLSAFPGIVCPLRSLRLENRLTPVVGRNGKQRLQNQLNTNKIVMVGEEGFEPPTNGV